MFAIQSFDINIFLIINLSTDAIGLANVEYIIYVHHPAALLWKFSTWTVGPLEMIIMSTLLMFIVCIS